MSFVTVLLVLAMSSLSWTQEPTRVDPARPSAGAPAYREARKGESVIVGLLQRVECPRGGRVRFTLKVKDAVERFEALRLNDVEFISHTPDFQGPLTCGGRGKGDRVRLTWKKAGTARRAVAVEFLPADKE